MPSFSSIFKRKEGAGTPFKAKTKRTAEQNGAPPVPPQKPQWEDAWLRKDVDPDEVQELLQGCTYEIKSRGKFSTLDSATRLQDSPLRNPAHFDYPSSSGYTILATTFSTGLRS